MAVLELMQMQKEGEGRTVSTASAFSLTRFPEISGCKILGPNEGSRLFNASSSNSIRSTIFSPHWYSLSYPQKHQSKHTATVHKMLLSHDATQLTFQLPVFAFPNPAHVVVAFCIAHAPLRLTKLPSVSSRFLAADWKW